MLEHAVLSALTQLFPLTQKKAIKTSQKSFFYDLLVNMNLHSKSEKYLTCLNRECVRHNHIHRIANLCNTLNYSFNYVAEQGQESKQRPSLYPQAGPALSQSALQSDKKRKGQNAIRSSVRSSGQHSAERQGEGGQEYDLIRITLSF